jgi:hypothetical protein
MPDFFSLVLGQNSIIQQPHGKEIAMSKVHTFVHILGIAIALAATQLASAADCGPQENTANASAKPVADKVLAQPLDADVLQGLEAPAAGLAPQKDEGPDPANTPYVTFDGAPSSYSDR